MYRLYVLGLAKVVDCPRFAWQKLFVSYATHRPVIGQGTLLSPSDIKRLGTAPNNIQLSSSVAPSCALGDMVWGTDSSQFSAPSADPHEFELFYSHAIWRKGVAHNLISMASRRRLLLRTDVSRGWMAAPQKIDPEIGRGENNLPFGGGVSL